MGTTARPLAVITGASSGIGLELARCCVQGGYDAVISADGPEIHDVALGLRASGANVEVVQADLKALLDSFSFALRAELKDSGVSVTCLMPGATETDFFETADMLDTKVGASKKQPPHEVAKAGFEAMMRGDGDVVAGWGNKLRQAIANVIPSGALAAQHAKLAKPGSA